jgi:hypothetical protein
MTGMAFGESVLLGGSENNRWFNAVAMSDTICLQLSKHDFDYVMCSNERKIFKEKMEFLRSIPEFK